MHGEFGEVFSRIFWPINKHKPDYFGNELLEVVSGQCISSVCAHILFSQFFLMDLQIQRQDARRKPSMMHLIPFMWHLLITALQQPQYFFSPLSGNWSPQSALCLRIAEPAALCTRALRERRWVGARVRDRFNSRWYLGLSVVAQSRSISSAARLLVI